MPRLDLSHGDRHIVDVIAHADDFSVTLLWGDRTWSVVDLKPTIALGGAFARLADPEVFAGVNVAPCGNAIVWDGGPDFDARMLWPEAALLNADLERQ